MALRQAREQKEKSGKQFTVRDLRTMADKTKRNLIEACKLKESTITIAKDVTGYDSSCQEKLRAEYESKLAMWQQKVLDRQKERDKLLELLRERTEFFKKIKETNHLSKQVLAEKQ